MSWKLEGSMTDATPEIREYYRKKIYEFVSAVEEIGLDNVFALAKDQLERDIETRQKLVDDAVKGLENTKDLAKKLGVIME